MKTLPEQDAVGLFHRIRDGGDIETILRHVRDGDLLLQMHLIPEARLRYELPYSRDMPAILLTSESPSLDSIIYKAASQRTLRSKIVKASATEPQKDVFPAEYTPMYQDPYVKPYHAAVLVEPRFENARISEWIRVCKDNVLLRN